METGARPKNPARDETLTPEQEAVAKAAQAWVQQLARTLKNCRLYDARNPNVVRFRQQLALTATQLIEEHGEFTLQFSSDDVLCEGVSLYPAKSRDDNIALPFYRDGVRAITFQMGLETREVFALLDALLTSGQGDSEDDLVTHLWQAHLKHLDVDFVPTEGDVGTVAADGPIAPWPEAGSETVTEPNPTDAPGLEAVQGEEERSDDWSVGERADEIEAGFAELDEIAAAEVERFRGEFEAEHALPPVAVALAIARAYAAAEADPEDLVELAVFLPRVLRIAAQEGRWREAHETLRMLRTKGGDGWSLDTFSQEIQQPVSVAAIAGRLEKQEAEDAAEFVSFVQDLGDLSLDLLNLILASLETPRHQRVVSDAIVEKCRTNPERLAPWLADPRPNVVRNVVHMLGAIGGKEVVPVLAPIVEHRDVAVRLDVANALRGVDPRSAQPLLLKFLDDKDARIFCVAIHQLAEAHDAAVATRALALMLAPEFHARSGEEKRAIYTVLGAAGGDDVVTELEAELLKGNWFARGDDSHQQAVARCLWRIGTPRARIALENGAHSKRSPVRALCEQMLARWDQRG